MTRLSRPSRSNRRRYGQVPSSNSLRSEDGGDGDGEQSPEHEHEQDDHHDGGYDLEAPATENSPLSSSTCSQHEDKDDGTSITITILDTAHSKFYVRADPSWTVARFKAAGTARHGVSASSQRLIYMGRLLDDMSSLEECGLGSGGSGGGDDGQESHNKIVHLFPKPNVVVRTEDEHGDVSRALSAGGRGGGDSSTASSGNPSTGNNPAGRSGAHVPQIYLDANEASSPVLILSSQEIFEAMHRVKLLSFLLLIMSSMELMTLFSVMMGGVPDTDAANGYSRYGGGGGYDIPPGDPTDTGPPAPSYDGQQVQMRTWRNSDYADLAVSCLGLYVSTLGIKATTESTVFLARQYFTGLVLAGLAWNAYQYYLNVQIYKEAEEAAEQAAEDADDGGDGGSGGGFGPNEPPDYGSPYSAALGTLMIPMAVWFMCWFRAWEFQSLMVQAEEEAHERSRMLTGGQNGNGDEEEGATRSEEDEDDGDDGERRGNNEEALQVVDETEFSVQVEGRSIT